MYANRNDLIILDGTNSSSDNAGHNILTDSVSEVADTYTTATDQIVLEFDTFEDILHHPLSLDQSKKFKFQVVVKVIRNYQLSLLQLQLELVHHFLQLQKVLVQQGQ